MSDIRFFDLTIPAPQRLALMRAAFANHPNKYPHCPEHAKPQTWRDVRGWTLGSWRAAFCAGLNPGFNGTGRARVPVWYSHKGPNFRDEKPAHNCKGGPNHTGWFTDVDHDEKAFGIVARLPHGHFIAGYMWTANDERIYFPDVFTDEREAARAADSHAERWADIARDDNEKREAARTLEHEMDEALTRLRECLALRHRACMAYVRDEARELCESIREMRETLRTEYADYV